MLKKSSENDQSTGHFRALFVPPLISELFFVPPFPPPSLPPLPPPPDFSPRKSTNKKILALVLTTINYLLNIGSEQSLIRLLL